MPSGETSQWDVFDVFYVLVSCVVAVVAFVRRRRRLGGGGGGDGDGGKAADNDRGGLRWIERCARRVTACRVLTFQLFGESGVVVGAG